MASRTWRWCELARASSLIAAVAVAFVTCGCSKQAAPPSITLATTTSTQDSGLLDHLLPIFERQTKIEVKVVAVGSGQAMALGRRGDADVLLTHSPSAEQAFMDEGFGSSRKAVMHNDFVLVGPAADPAKIGGHHEAADALRAVAEGSHPFVSRGDDSGTHQKELALWKAAGTEPEGDWYIDAGSGMVQTLRIASEKQAYVLADRGTLLAHRRDLQLHVLVEGDERLLNRYSVMVVSVKVHPHVNEQAATTLAGFLTSELGQQEIARFGSERYGEPLFVPDALAAGQSP